MLHDPPFSIPWPLCVGLFLESRNHVTLCVVQINMMLANLYRKAGQERSAVTSYKEVLRQCPLALDAIIGRWGQVEVAHLHQVHVGNRSLRRLRRRSAVSVGEGS